MVTLRLINPGRRNALGAAAASEFRDAFADLASDRSVAALILACDGDHFCSGGDLDMILGWSELEGAAIADEVRLFYRSFLGMRRLPFPVVAAVKGVALGAGLSLMLAADLSVVAEDARLAATFIHLGIHPGMGSTSLFSQTLGPSLALDLLLTGRSLSGMEAHDLHLATRCVPAAEVDTTALAIAKTIAKQPEVARLLKRTVYLAQRMGPEDALEVEALAQGVNIPSWKVRELLAQATKGSR
ncbi:MAG: enoyl-CoA hydratase/isomerase family protein [Actinomycetota bacterium]